MDFSKISGQTPINDASGLIPTHINTQKELNEWESNNILTATKKYLSRKSKYVITHVGDKCHLDVINNPNGLKIITIWKINLKIQI